MIRSCGPVEKTVQQLRGPSMGELACKENGKQCNFASCSPCRASYRGDITLQNACQAVICLLKCWSITLFKLIIHCQIIIQRASGAHWRPAEGADGQQAATSTVADSWLFVVFPQQVFLEELKTPLFFFLVLRLSSIMNGTVSKHSHCCQQMEKQKEKNLSSTND